MQIRIVSFTKKGRELSERIEKAFPEHVFLRYKKGEDNLTEFTEAAFKGNNPLLFIGAMGIAVRTIAPFVEDKLKDPPVIVIDELGKHVIPILSGHIGGANELALSVAERIEAIPVVTTATDLNQAFSVDLFAKENNLEIVNREGIARTSMKALEGKPITISVQNYPPKNDVDVMVLDGLFIKSGLVVGVGCKRGKTTTEIQAFVDECLEMIGATKSDISAISSIDIKADEEGLIELSKELSVPFITFEKDLLEKVNGSFSSSDFVKSKVGVDNVCERSAVLARGKGAEILLKKQSRDGITVAIAGTKKDNKTIYVVGMGPGTEKLITPEAKEALDRADTIIGYTVYLDLLKNRYPEKEMLSTPMTKEVERCRICFREAAKGKSVAMVCSGDPGVYGMASIMHELLDEVNGNFRIKVIPGITAAMSGAAILGAPINHDFCVISLSDLLTPWELIERRLRAAAEGDLAIAIYNPSSRKRNDYLGRACSILAETIELNRPCGYVKNIGRDGETYRVCSMADLIEAESKGEIDMFTTVFIGNSQTRIIGDKLVTPRGYLSKPGVSNEKI